MRVVVIVLSALLFTPRLSISQSPIAQDEERIPVYKNNLNCGPNALFMFLILLGRTEIKIDQLSDIPIATDGSSLIDLREAAKRLGVQTEIRKYRAVDVEFMALPAIAQFKPSGSSVNLYHFNVIYKVDATKVYLLDGTTGFKRVFHLSRLPDFWTGVAMTPVRLTAAKPSMTLRALEPRMELLLIDLILFGCCASLMFRRRSCK